MVILMAAWGAPVVCDPARARSLLQETGLAEHRVPEVAPWLLPGIVWEDATGGTRAILDEVCADPARVSLAPGEAWQGGTFGAHLFSLTESHTEDCALVQRSVTLTVGIRRGEIVTGVLDRAPPTVTPIGDCVVQPAWRDEIAVAGEGSPVRVLVQVDHRGDTSDTRLLVRRATPTGWHQQVLMEPAPERLTGGFAGPRVTLTTSDDPWIVLHHGRSGSEETCVAEPGQVVWHWTGGAWESWTDREGLGRLADRGYWRLATDPGWFLIVAQDDPSDRALLEARVRKRQSLGPDPLHIRESGVFPLLNAGFFIAGPDPWTTREAAEAARRAWPRKTGAYVRQGWIPEPSCAPGG